MTDKPFKEELDRLISLGTSILHVGVFEAGKQDFGKETTKHLNELAAALGDYKKKYQVWYARAIRVVKILAPERLAEFEEYYTGKKNIKSLDYLTAGITHYFQGIISTRGFNEQDYYGKFTSGIQQQINILAGIAENLEDVLFNIESEIHYGIFKSELDAAKQILSSGQLRAAGAIAGVVIEGHLKLVCANHEIKFRKQNPTISDFNDALKKEKVIDTVMWRLISRTGDIRNYCVHSKERDPTKDEVEDIIRDAAKIISEVA